MSNDRELSSSCQFNGLILGEDKSVYVWCLNAECNWRVITSLYLNWIVFIFVALILVADHYTNMNDSSVGEEAAEKEETREFAYHAVSKHFYNNLLRFFTEKANSGDIDTRVLNLEREELVCSTKVLENLIRAHWTDVVTRVYVWCFLFELKSRLFLLN